MMNIPNINAVRSRVGMWGGSCAIRLPKMAVESLGLQEGEDVSLSIENGALVIRAARPQYELNDLVQQALVCDVPDSFDDPPVGDEAL